MSTILSENFDGVTAPALPTTFTYNGSYVTETAQFVSSPNGISLTTDSQYRYVVPTLGNDSNGGNTQITLSYRWTNSQDSIIYTRGQGQILGTQDSTTRFYGMRFNSSGVLIIKKIGTVTTTLSNVTATPLAADTWYTIVFRAENTQLTLVSIQRLSDNFYMQTNGTFGASPPTFVKQITDSSITGVGMSAWGTQANGAGTSVWFDSYLWETYGASGLVDVPVNDTNVFTSPDNWQKNGATNIITVNPGAYVKMGFTGGTLAATLACPAFTGSVLGILCQVDGNTTYNQLLDTTSANSTLVLASGLAAGTHQGTIYCYAGDSSQDHWTNNPPTMSLVITKFQIDTGASTAAPSLLSKRAIIYGDSTGMGTTTDRLISNPTVGFDDGMHAPLALAAFGLDLEYGIISFGSNGYVTSGTGNVPVFSSNYNYYWSSNSRLSGGVLIDSVDYLIDYKGSSDFTAGASASSVQAAAIVMFPLLRTVAPTAKFFKIVPPSDAYLANFLTAFDTCFGGHTTIATAGGATIYQGGSDKDAYLIDLGSNIAQGLQDKDVRPASWTANDSVHPDVAHNGRIAGILSTLISLALHPGGGGGGKVLTMLNN